MGLLSKIQKCERCGKEFKTSNSKGPFYCPDCSNYYYYSRKVVEGYDRYNIWLKRPNYEDKQLESISSHRADILHKYRKEEVNLLDFELMSMNWDTCDKNEAAEFLLRMYKSLIKNQLGSSLTVNFAVINHLSGVVVDFESVYAIALKPLMGLKNEALGAVMCVLFTTDPYVPVAPIIYVENEKPQRNFLGLPNSDRNFTKTREFISSIFKNLKHPIFTANELKKKLDKGEVIEGPVDAKTMKYAIKDAIHEVGLFNTTSMKSVMDDTTAKMLNAYGYIQTVDMNRMMNLNKYSKRFWDEVFEIIVKNDKRTE